MIVSDRMIALRGRAAMFGAIAWPLVVVMVWAGVFLAALAFAQYSARTHDQDSASEEQRAAS